MSPPGNLLKDSSHFLREIGLSRSEKASCSCTKRICDIFTKTRTLVMKSVNWRSGLGFWKYCVIWSWYDSSSHITIVSHTSVALISVGFRSNIHPNCSANDASCFVFWISWYTSWVLRISDHVRPMPLHTDDGQTEASTANWLIATSVVKHDRV